MNYFTSIEYVNGQYVGVAFNTSNNTAVYRSRPYQTQPDALSDVNTFIGKQAVAPGTTVTNSTVYTAPVASRPTVKCCGRG
jgi:hypothetical protein